jgi:hypothetical protein
MAGPTNSDQCADGRERNREDLEQQLLNPGFAREAAKGRAD